MRTCLVIGLLAVVGCSAPAMSTEDVQSVDSTSEAYTSGNLYTALKQVEVLLPKPVASATGDVGTLDGSTGDFAGHMTEIRIDPRTNKPVLHPAVLNVVGVRAVLTWEATNRGALPFQVTVNGVTHVAPAGAAQIRVDVGGATKVTWSEKIGGE